MICSLSLLVIAIVFAMLAELPTLEHENGVELFIQAILSGIPLLIEVIAPISVLLATVLALISLSRTSEIIAMMAAGVSFLHLVLPIIICGIFIGALLYLNQSYLAPHWGADKRAGLVRTIKNPDIWRFHKDSLYFFSAPNKTEKSVPYSRSFHFDNGYHLRSAGFSSKLTQDEKNWFLNEYWKVFIEEQSITQSEKIDHKISREKFPVVFTKDLVNPKYSSFIDLYVEIAIKMRGAVNYKPELFALYQKTAGLLSVFVMILLALPFSIYSGRSANVRTGIVISIVLGFVFWLVDQILLSFNSTGLVPMEVSAFGANVLFLSLALFLIRRKKT